MIFGTFIGSYADKMGRKRFAQLFCVMYMASCVTKHFDSYGILLLGRFFGGVATSLLFSVFESWMVGEVESYKFANDQQRQDVISDTTSMAVLFDSITAILSGFIAEYASGYVDLVQVGNGIYFGQYCSPFDLSFIVLGVCGVLITLRWTENYGDQSSSTGLSIDALRSATQVIFSDRKILSIGLISALFEGSMYSFVFLWTPLLKSVDSSVLPYGLIFAIFMMSCMAGSSIFSIMSAKWHWKVEKIGILVFLASSLSLLVPVLARSAFVTMMSLMLFEVCVGLYWPTIITLKAMYIPGEFRSSIYNVFRVPMNAIVLFVLLSNLEVYTVFFMCAVNLAIAFALQINLNLIIEKENASSRDVKGSKEPPTTEMQ